MIDSLNERLTETRESIRQKQKLEKDLLQIKETLAAERSKYSRLKKQLLKEGRDVRKLESLSLSRLFLTILGSKETQLEKERQEYLAAKLRYDECKSDVAALESDEQSIMKQLESMSGLDDRYRGLLAEKESLILSGDDS